MFSICKDIRFLEKLKKQAGFGAAYLLVLADDPLFYSGRKMDDIYGYFRAGVPLNGHINKPTGAQDELVNLNGNYAVQWIPVFGDLQFFVLDI